MKLPGVAAFTAAAISGSLAPDEPPSALAKNDDRYSSPGQILLVPDVPIGGEEHIESCVFRGVQQLAVSEGIPAMGAGFLDDVTR